MCRLFQSANTPLRLLAFQAKGKADSIVMLSSARGVKHFKTKHMVNRNCLLLNLYSRPEPILRSHKWLAERVDSCRPFTKE